MRVRTRGERIGRCAGTAVTILLLASLSAVPSAAHAQAASGAATPTASEIATARDLFVQAATAARELRWQEAADLFSRSYALYPRALTEYNVAGALAQSGHLVEAEEAYRRFLRDATPQDGGRLRDAAQSALDALLPRIPHVRITVQGLLPGDAVTLDGDALPSAVVGASVPVDPGDHVLAVTRAGAEAARQPFHAAERAASEVSLVVPAPAVAPHGPAHGVEHGEHADHGGHGEHAAHRAPNVVPTARETAVRANARSTAASHTAGPPHTRGPQAESSGGILTRWWFWTVVGVVVAAAATVTVVVATSGGPSPFQGNVSPGVLQVP